MQIEVSYGDLDSSPALTQHVNDAVTKALHHVAKRVTRVEAHLHDDNANKRGADDRRCTLEARIAGEKPLAVEARGDDIYQVVTDAAGKLSRAVTRKLEKMDA